MKCIRLTQQHHGWPEKQVLRCTEKLAEYVVRIGRAVFVNKETWKEAGRAYWY